MTLSYSCPPMEEPGKYCAKCGGALSRKMEGGRERPWCPSCNRCVYGRFTIGVGGLLLHGGRVLMIQRGHEPGRGRWTLPGGYVEEDESPDQTVIREVLEETGLKVTVTGLAAIRHAQSRDGQNAYYVFGLRLAGSVADLLPDGDRDEVLKAIFIEPSRLDELGDIGAISKWIITRCKPEEPGLLVIPDAETPKFPSMQKWTVVYK